MSCLGLGDPQFSPHLLARRGFLQQTGLGFGALALSCLLQKKGLSLPARGADMTPKRGHVPARAKSVIMLFQNGGASHMDLFDPKPELNRRHGQQASGILARNLTEHKAPLKGSAFRFQPYGESGIPFSEVVPRLGSVADELCVIRSMFTNDPNHPGATYMMYTCNNRPGRPTLGAWTAYALGTENQNLPGYVLLRDPGAWHCGGGMQVTNGWLPAIYRGTEFRSEGDAVLNLNPAVPRPYGVQQNNLNLLAKLNDTQRRKYPHESILEARIQNLELAARMQLAAAELDLSSETKETKRLYGLDNELTASYGRSLLMARRLVERGVRFVQVLPPPPHSVWDHHGDLEKRLPVICGQTDLPAAGLITDLKRRGLLEETVVIWTGEFGRLPVGGSGRDHNPHGFTLLLAGGGLKAGHIHGATDELGYAAVEDRVGVPDLFATIFHLLGIDHERLTYEVHGTVEDVTDSKVNDARVVSELLA